jgi:hypothetical protein
MPVNNNQITTMNDAWVYRRNVREWTTDDVIEWLNREKLQM